jgi:TatD DNase family protein
LIFETHAHLQDRKLRGNVEQVLERARQAGVDKVVCVGYDLPSSEEAVSLARKFSQVYAAVGVHPHDAKTLTPEVLDKLKNLAADAKVVAIGEIGLDFYRDLSPRDLQKQAFIDQIKLAQKLGKPIIIHDREANQPVFDLVKQYKAGQNMGIMHCYSGNLPLAIEYIKLGFYISLAGPLTYKNARRPQEIASKVQLNRLLVETDCPYLTPEPLRGKVNEPANIKYVVEKMAEVRNQSPEEAAYLTARNAHQVFGLRM